MKLRQFPASLLVLVLVLAGAPAPASTVSLPPNAGAPPGSSTVFPLSIDDAAGILGTDILITYDPTVALPLQVNKTSLSSNHTLTFNLSTPGEIRISLFGGTPLSGEGALVDLAFESVGPANSAMELDLVSANLNEGSIPALLEDGRYCVQGLVGEAQSLVLRPTVPGSPLITLSWATDPSATAYNLYRGREADLNDLTCIRSSYPSTMTADATVLDPGGVHFFLVSTENCRGESTLGTDSAGVIRPNPTPCP